MITRLQNINFFIPRRTRARSSSSKSSYPSRRSRLPSMKLFALFITVGVTQPLNPWAAVRWTDMINSTNASRTRNPCQKLTVKEIRLSDGISHVLWPPPMTRTWDRLYQSLLPASYIAVADIHHGWTWHTLIRSQQTNAEPQPKNACLKVYTGSLIFGIHMPDTVRRKMNWKLVAGQNLRVTYQVDMKLASCFFTDSDAPINA